MKFKQYLALLAGPDGFIPTPHLQWVIRKNTRSTAREEAIVAEVIKQANPRENITGHFPWGPEEQMVLQQLWIKETKTPSGYRDYAYDVREEWRDVPIEGAEDLFSTVSTEHGDMPVPDAVREPGVVRGDFQGRIREAMGEEEGDG